MANKPLDRSGSCDIMLGPRAQAKRDKSGEDHAPATSGPVIITHDPIDDAAPCLWCVVELASEQHYPYCSLDCAVASSIDDEREKSGKL